MLHEKSLTYEEVRDWVMSNPFGDRTMSPIAIKYRYMISYMDAAKFLERLEQDGIVSQWDEVVGSPRTILKTSQSSGNV